MAASTLKLKLPDMSRTSKLGKEADDALLSCLSDASLHMQEAPEPAGANEALQSATSVQQLKDYPSRSWN